MRKTAAFSDGMSPEAHNAISGVSTMLTLEIISSRQWRSCNPFSPSNAQTR